MTGSLLNLGLRGLTWAGWLLLAPVLAGFVWAVLQHLDPLPVQPESAPKPDATRVLWVDQLDRYWQPLVAVEPESELIQPIEVSRLRVAIQGVFLSSIPGRSVVLLKYRNQDLTLSEGDELEEGVKLQEIRRDALIFNRQGQLEKVALELREEGLQQAAPHLLDQKAATEMPARSSTRPASREHPAVEASQEIAHQERVGTRPLEDTFGPDFRESLVSDPLQLMRHITLSPHNEGGRLQGFRIRPGSDPELFNRLGLKAGDLVTAVDGTPVSDTSAMMQLHGQLATARSLDVEILRAGERLLFSLEME